MSAAQKGALVLDMVAGEDVAGGALSVQNPDGDLIVTEAVLFVIEGTGAGDTVDVGVHDDPDGADDSLLAAAAIENDESVVGDEPYELVGADQYFVAEPSVDLRATDFEAVLYLRYVKV